MHQYLQQSMDRHLDHLAARLEIRASQQEAWKAFSTAVRAMVPAAPARTPAKTGCGRARAPGRPTAPLIGPSDWDSWPTRPPS